MECKKCGKKEAMVSVSEYGDLCAECYNSVIIDWNSAKDLESIRDKISVCDEEGTLHHFKIGDVNIGGLSFWNANEIDEKSGEEIECGYSFQIKTTIEGDQFSALIELREKVISGVYNKSCRVSKQSDTNNKKDDPCKLLKKQGVIGIMKDSATQEIIFSIDGKKVTLSEFGQMLSAYDGNNMEFQIQDKAAPIMGKYMVLKQVDVSPEAIWERFQTTLNWFVEDNFLNEKDRVACELILAERLEELALLHKSYSQEQALTLAEKIRQALHQIETNFSGFSTWTEAYIDRLRERALWISDHE